MAILGKLDTTQDLLSVLGVKKDGWSSLMKFEGISILRCGSRDSHILESTVRFHRTQARPPRLFLRDDPVDDPFRPLTLFSSPPPEVRHIAFFVDLL